MLANFLVEGLPLLLIVAGIILVIRSRRGGPHRKAQLYLGLFLLSLPMGALAYIVVGIKAAAIRGQGHFYSVPFGGYAISNDVSLGLSLLIWITLAFLCLTLLTRFVR